MVDDKESVSSGSGSGSVVGSSQGASSTEDAASTPSTQTAGNAGYSDSLVGNETRHIRCSRAVFLSFLVVLAAAACLATYFSVKGLEQYEFQLQVWRDFA
jgi:hypothetical protein